MTTQHTPRCLLLLTARDDVLSCWLGWLRAQVPYATSIPAPILINHLPTFYDHLAATACGEDEAFDFGAIASDHGGQRARVTRYNAGSLVHEFQLFRAALLHVWDGLGVTLELDEVARLNDVVDTALRASLTGFSLCEARIREQFFCALTHDLRTPLSTASAAIDIIHKTEDLARARRLAEMARRQHPKLDSMISDLLDMMVSHTAAVALELEPCDLHDLVAETIADIVLSSNRAIGLAGGPVPGLWCVAELRRAVENLLNNAVKYSDDGTTIDVHVREENGRALVSVANTGPTIPPDQIDVIFQLFRRSPRGEDRGITGWGIGLPYVRSVAERHGGNISVQSADAVTTFVLDVPVDPTPVIRQGS